MDCKKLIEEARELYNAANSWMQKLCGSMSATAYFEVNNAIEQIPALCDALEEAQSALEQTWEWDMYQAAKREIERLRNTNKALENDNYNAEMNLAHLTAELEAAQNAQRWVPVEERLPEDCTDILFWANGEVCLGIMRYDGKFVDYGRREYPHEQRKVTHWMPLPEAPREEE